jgi:hypothetical protein
MARNIKIEIDRRRSPTSMVKRPWPQLKADVNKAVNHWPATPPVLSIS